MNYFIEHFEIDYVYEASALYYAGTNIPLAHRSERKIFNTREEAADWLVKKKQQFTKGHKSKFSDLSMLTTLRTDKDVRLEEFLGMDRTLYFIDIYPKIDGYGNELKWRKEWKSGE